MPIVFGSPESREVLRRDGGFEFDLRGIDPLEFHPMPSARHERLAQELGQADEEDGSWCVVCGNYMEWEDCWQCGGKGGRDGEDLMDEDPLWYDEDDWEECDICRGNGGYWICPNAAQHDREERKEPGER